MFLSFTDLNAEYHELINFYFSVSLPNSLALRMLI